MLTKIPKKLFEREINDVRAGINNIHLYNEDEIENAQQGYRVNGLTNEVIEEWLGDEYYVIGNDSCCGDPIIIKVDNEKLPIYTMFHDDWSTLHLIAETYNSYLEALKLIAETDLKDITEVEKLIDSIKRLVPESAFNYYWEDLIRNAHEFLIEE